MIEAFDEDSQPSAARAVSGRGDGSGARAGLRGAGAARSHGIASPAPMGRMLACVSLYEQLELDRFWAPRLPDSREGTRWRHILQTLVCYRLIDPGSEWRLHRLWFEQSAMADLLGADYSLVEKNALYRCLDKLLAHKTALFGHLRQRWQDLFGAKFEVLLYDLTSTYFESDPPDDEADKRRHGYSRDKRSDCVQVVIALIVTPEGFPLAYEVLPGNTADNTTLRGFLREDRGAVRQGAAHLGDGSRHSDRGGACRDAPGRSAGLVSGRHAQGRLSKLEKALLDRPWQAVREGVDVKLLPQEQELYVLAQSHARIAQGTRHATAQAEMAMGAAQGALRHAPDARGTAHEARRRARQGPAAGGGGRRRPQIAASAMRSTATSCAARRREGRYLLRTNLCDTSREAVEDSTSSWPKSRRVQEPQGRPATASDLPSTDRARRSAHLRRLPGLLSPRHAARRLRPLAGGLTPRAVLDKFAAIQMLDVHFPTTDGRTLILSRYTELKRQTRGSAIVLDDLLRIGAPLGLDG